MPEATTEVTDQELKKVIRDFLDEGLAENIVIMFRRNPAYLEWTGDILKDDRLSVRLGVSMLMEELRAQIPAELPRAIPSLLPLLTDPEPLWRGEAVSVLGMLGTPDVIEYIRPLHEDPSPQVREMVEIVLDELS